MIFEKSVCLIDFEEAFDRVQWDKLSENINVSVTLLQLVLLMGSQSGG